MKIQLGHPMKSIYKAFLFVLFVLNFSLSTHADTMDRAIFAYDEGDYETAISIFSSLANEGDKIAKGYLVSSYIAVEDYDSLKRHLPEIEKLAQSGDANFQYILSSILRLEVDGISNGSEARRWLISAAELGNADAISALGELERNEEIRQLQKEITFIEALPAAFALILALAVLLLKSFVGQAVQRFFREVFLVTIAFSIAQLMLDSFEFLPMLSSIINVMGADLIFILLVYFIIRKYLSVKIV